MRPAHSPAMKARSSSCSDIVDAVSRIDLRDAADLMEDDAALKEAPVLQLSGRQTDYLEVARSVADKFIIRCLLDETLRPFYGSAKALMQLKARQVESILAAMRFGGQGPASRISLEAHRGLSEEHLGRLRVHLEAAAREHALLAQGTSRLADADELVARLSSVPGLPLALLPAENQKEEVEEQATAMKRKGGDDHHTKVVGGLELAPLRIPIKRRRQMFGCMVCCSLVPGAVLTTGLCFLYWRRMWPLLVSYMPWVFFFDRAPWRGGRRPWASLRRSSLFRWFSEYFPASLIKANPRADFSGTRPMLMGYHPHGILSFGAVCNFGTDTTGWSDKFPNLSPRICTLNLNIKLPFLREILTRLGFIAASRGSVKSALRPGNAVILVVGGAAEALDTKPGEYVLTLKRRTGFFRLAMEHGADLVPTFGFGENDIYETVGREGTLWYRLQRRVYKWLTFTLPVFYGRNVFSYNMGPLPYRRPLTVVVGEPIRVDKNQSPTSEELEDLRSRYIKALRKLYDEWQPRLEPGRETPLIVV